MPITQFHHCVAVGHRSGHPVTLHCEARESRQEELGAGGGSGTQSPGGDEAVLRPPVGGVEAGCERSCLPSWIPGRTCDSFTTIKIMNVSMTLQVSLWTFLIFPLPPAPRQSWVCFLSLQKSQDFLKFYINESMRCILFFCLTCFTHHYHSEIHSCSYVYRSLPSIAEQYYFICWQTSGLLPVFSYHK